MNPLLSLQVLAMLIPVEPTTDKEKRDAAIVVGLFAQTLFYVDAYGAKGVSYAADAFKPRDISDTKLHDLLSGWRYFARGMPEEAKSWEGFEALVERAKELPGVWHTRGALALVQAIGALRASTYLGDKLATT